MPSRHKRALPFRRSVPILVTAAAVAGLLTITATSTASKSRSTSRGKLLATGLTPDSTYTGAKSASGYAAKTDRSLLRLHGSKLVNEPSPHRDFEGPPPGSPSLSVR